MDGIPMRAQAGFWGFVAGAALLVGAAAGYYFKVPERLIAAIMAFGSGVLISALSFELVDEAFRQGGFRATAFGFLAGAAPSIASAPAGSSPAKPKTKAAASRSPSAPCSTAFRSRS